MKQSAFLFTGFITMTKRNMYEKYDSFPLEFKKFMNCYSKHKTKLKYTVI